MKKAKVFLKDQLAGILIENEEGYTFLYDSEFLKSEGIKVGKSKLYNLCKQYGIPTNPKRKINE